MYKTTLLYQYKLVFNPCYEHIMDKLKIIILEESTDLSAEI
jgi:hypothetical protein